MTQESVHNLQKRLELRERQLNVVHRISAALFSKVDLDTLLRETLHISLETVEADAGSILLYDSDRRKLVFRYVLGKTELIGAEIDPDEDRSGKAAAVFRSGQSLLTADTRTDGHNARFDVETGYRTENMLTVPLKSRGGEPIGVMQALNKRSGTFDAEDQELLEIVGSLAATSIVNARLAEEAQLAAVARAVGDLGHDIKNDLTPIETMMDTTVELFVVPMLGELDRLTETWRPGHPDMAAAVEQATQPLRDWYPEAQSSVRDGCADIRELVSEITDYVKGTQATNMQVAAIKEVITERLRRLEVIAQDRRVIIRMEGLENVPPFAFDRRLLGRAVYNLVHNALNAIDDAVRKKVVPFRTFHIQVAAEAVTEGDFPDGNYCLIRVTDDGPGIEPRVRESLFTPQAISTTPGGTGIGTRFVKSVADAHKGLVGVESEPGQGACFWIKLPLA
jgi:signal transduction histidine kinase